MFEDAKHIKPLTKQEMIDFFNEFVDPASPARAKLAVHMHALGVSKASTETPTPVGDKVQQIIEDGVQQVETELAKAGLVDGKTEGETEANGVRKVVIEDVREFKAGLAVTRGPRAVRDVSVFEELEAKL